MTLTEDELFIFLNGFGAGVAFGIRTFITEIKLPIPEAKLQNIPTNISHVVMLALHEKYPDMVLTEQNTRLTEILARLETENLIEIITTSYDAFRRAGPASI